MATSLILLSNDVLFAVPVLSPLTQDAGNPARIRFVPDCVSTIHWISNSRDARFNMRSPFRGMMNSPFKPRRQEETLRNDATCREHGATGQGQKNIAFIWYGALHLAGLYACLIMRTRAAKGHHMTTHFGRISFAILLATAPMQAQAKNEKAWATASDVGVAGLSIVALGLPIAQGDKQGAFQAAGSIGASALITTGLKYTFPELRPDGSDRKSFPSGHTSTAFAAAATLYNRQGADIGIPAMLAASFVGLARVQADKHHWYDVVAGAGIGTASGFLITRKRSERQALVLPWGDSKSAGVSVAMRF